VKHVPSVPDMTAIHDLFWAGCGNGIRAGVRDGKPTLNRCPMNSAVRSGENTPDATIRLLAKPLAVVTMDFQDIYHHHEPKVKQFIRALVRDDWVADDLVQETFISVQKNLDRLRDPSRLSAWVYRIAYNRCQDHFRRLGQAAKQEQVLSQKTDMLSEPLFLKAYDQHQMGACVRHKVSLLPEKYRSVLVLFDLLDFSHKEIAEILDISVDNVKVRLHRGRRQLKTILRNACRLENDERNVLICEPIENGRCQ